MIIKKKLNGLDSVTGLTEFRTSSMRNWHKTKTFEPRDIDEKAVKR